jgi:ADP-heptose:LPS heptosyltransferase
MVSGAHALDLGGETSFAQFAAIVRGAAVVVSGNTAAAHVASAVGTPVVSIFPPTIPALRFRPWMVPYALLGDQDVPCAGCRARICPIEGQPCLDVVHVDDVLRAVRSFAPTPAEVA